VTGLWSRMETKYLSLDHALADLAASQHGVASVGQLLALGLGRSAIKHRVRAGRLHRVYHRVYAVGHSQISYLGRCMAAVLACGDRAALSYRAAGQLWGLRTGSWIEVTVPRGQPGPRGLGIHQTRRLPPTVINEGIRVTTLGRTLVDLADVLSASRLEAAFADAERLRLLDLADIRPIPGRRGEGNLTRVLAGLLSAETKSELERRFAVFLRDYGLPWPVFNTLVDGIEVDVLWPDRRLIVELDSYEYHGRARKPFEDDRDRDIRLQLAGYTVIRVTSRKLDRQGELAQQLERLLSR
jgi:very-short-patch-repair endonuclease